MTQEIDNWFEFVEDYYSKSTVPLSWALIGGGEITAFRTAGSPSGMTTLSKREWNKIVGEHNAPRRNLPRGVTPTRVNKIVGEYNALRRNLPRGVTPTGGKGQ